MQKIVSSENTTQRMVCYELSSQEFLACKRAAVQVASVRSRWASNKQSQWAKGMHGSRSLSTLIGFVGEVAMWNILSCHFRTIPRYNIDVDYGVKSQDFVWKTPVGEKHEVKTTVAAPDGDLNYLRTDAVEKSDVFWFMSMRETNVPEVYMRGWCTRQQVKDRSTIKHGKGNWSNYVIETERLNTVGSFLQFKNRRRHS